LTLVTSRAAVAAPARYEPVARSSSRADANADTPMLRIEIAIAVAPVRYAQSHCTGIRLSR
jgi:hypothetical protein